MSARTPTLITMIVPLISFEFLIYMLGKNIEPTCYTEVIEDFAANLPSRQKNGKAAALKNGDHEGA